MNTRDTNRKGETAGEVILGIFLIISLITATVIGLISIGESNATRAEQQKAVKANVGQWTTNAKTGEQKFVYGIVE